MKYQKSWESLVKHDTPEWYLDQKFGIYAHWGLYSIPGFGNEWYAKRMYEPDSPIYKEHIEKIGPIAETGYTKYIEKFTAEAFEPEEWGDLFKSSGAGYGGFSLAHHDGFGLWDSDVYRWNVGKMGPKRDLYGELATSLKKRDIKLVAPFHIIRGFNWFLPGWNQYDQVFDEEIVNRGKKEGWEIFDKDKADFYWNQFTGNFEDFLNQWVLKVKEVVDKYQPDLMWFDGGRFSEPDLEGYSLDVLAHYFNKAEEWGKDVSILNKFGINLKHNFHRDLGIWQYEAGRDRSPFVNRPWNDDMRIGSDSWGYLHNQTYMSGQELLNGLIDRTARGGSLMLSLSPMGNGSIPESQREPLRVVGEWLAVNGEAINATRPWKIPAEGNISKMRGERLVQTLYGAEPHPIWYFENSNALDIRYTQSKDKKNLYVISLGQPKNEIKLEALGRMADNLDREPRKITLLDGNIPVTWRWEEDALYIKDIPFDQKRDDREPKAWKIIL